MPDQPPIPTSDPRAEAGRRRWLGVRRWAVRVFWTVACLSIATLLWALWYVNDRGFTRKWRGMVVKELAKRGIQAEIGRLNLNPLKGLVARNVRLVHGDKEVFASIDEVALDIHYSNLVWGGPFLNAIDLRDASLRLVPRDREATAEPILVDQIHARILFPPGYVHIPQARAQVEGVRLTATDWRLVNQGKLPTFPPRKERPAGEPSPLEAFRRVIRRMAPGNPTLELRVDGDPAQPASMRVEAQLRADAFTLPGNDPASQGYRVGPLQVAATWQDGLLRLNQGTLHDAFGALELSATYSPERRQALFSLHSTLNLPALHEALGLPGAPSGFRLHTPATLRAEGEATFPKGEKPDIRLTGQLEMGRFHYRSAAFQKAQAEFSWDGKRWFLRDARLHHAEGSVQLQALSTPEDGVRLALESQIHPTFIRPLLAPRDAALLDEFRFESTPVIRFEARGPSLQPKGWNGGGYVSLGKMAYRNVGLQSLTSDITLRNAVLGFPGFKVRRSEGNASGNISFDFNTFVAHLSDVRTSVYPVEAAVWVDRAGHLPKALAPYRVQGPPPRVKVEGDVGFRRNDEKHRLFIDVDAEQIGYTFLKRDLVFPRLKARLHLIHDRLTIESLEASLFGGQVSGGAEIGIKPDQGDYTGKVEAKGVDFPSLTDLYFDYDTSKGRLSGEYRFSGRGPDIRKHQGRGRLLVHDGNVFAIPVFGPLSGMLDKVLPGTGYNIARQATAALTLNGAEVAIDDLEVQGNGFSMYGGGKLHFLEDKMDFSIRINAQGAAGVVLSPVSHLFEYVSDGKLSKPQWRPKHLPKAVFSQ